MKVLVVGGGGREHALCWALGASPLVEAVLCAPGNAGIAEVARCVPVKADDLDGLVALAQAEQVGLVVVGPEVPLVLGLVDRLQAVGVRAFGPTAAAARLEGSKAFTKAFCARHGIPTAAAHTFGPDEREAARAHVRAAGAPIVVKADGLAAGKGVVVAATVEEALAAIDGNDGVAGDRGVPRGRGGEPVRALRRDDGPGDRHRPGPQARLRRRPGPEYRRHGRLQPGTAPGRGVDRARDGGDRAADAGRDGGGRRSVHGLSLRRPDADADRAEADRVQCPLRRSRMPGRAAAADDRSRPAPRWVPWTGCWGTWTCAGCRSTR